MRQRIWLAAALMLAAPGCADEPPTEPWGVAADPIVGGVEDDGHAYVVGVGDDFNGAWCSGTLVSAQTVLTAAHCAIGITRVYFGKNLTASAAADIELIHPLYTGDLTTPDLALVRLAAPVAAQPAPLLRLTLANTPEFIGPPWTWVGFGMNDPGMMLGFGTRRVTTIPVAAIGPATTMNGEPITEAFIYYETSGSSPCFGDSGGPAFFIDQGVEHASAVASWVGDELCSSYGAHARADAPMIASWIQANIDSFEASGPCRNDGSCNEACNSATDVLDPDCHAAHCAADGLCALACVAPVDPDCAGIVNHCGADGVCDESCMPPDPDCGGGPSVTVSTSSVTTSTVTSSTATTTTSVTTSSTTTGGGSGAGQATGGAGGAGPRRIDDDTRIYSRGCACRLAPTRTPTSGLSLLALAAVFFVRRRPASGMRASGCLLPRSPARRARPARARVRVAATQTG
jgi:MYXO-CTERM domain-containing protein